MGRGSHQEAFQVFTNGLKDPAFLVYLAGDEANPACRGVDQEVFFPKRGGSTVPAKDICAVCDELAGCRAWALRQNSYLHGVWGMTSWLERNRR